jgi:hypothetical protein
MGDCDHSLGEYMAEVLTQTRGAVSTLIYPRRIRRGDLLALLLVLIFFGAGFALHILWIVAAVLFVLWLVGFAMGRGESAGSRHF